MANNQGERKKLYGVVFQGPAEEGSKLVMADKTDARAGVITSVLPLGKHHRALAYINKAAGGPGAKVSKDERL